MEKKKLSKKPSSKPRAPRATKIEARASAKPRPKKGKVLAKRATSKSRAPANGASAKAPAPAKQVKAAPASKAAAPRAGAAIGEGSRAPTFELTDHDGKPVSSKSLGGKPYVLYFYPKDDTPGCTREACDFRDFGGKFRGVRILGVSPDSSASHARFRAKYGLPFTLISDADKTLANAYGVWVKKQNYGREYMGIERSTFLVDGSGVIKKAWRGVRVPGHVESVLAAL